MATQPTKLHEAPKAETETPTVAPRLVSSINSQEVARQKADEYVKNISTEGLMALDKLRKEVDNATMAMQEQQADLAAAIFKFFQFTADTITAVKVMETEMANITNHFKPEQK